MDVVHHLVSDSPVVLQHIVATPFWRVVLVKLQHPGQFLHNGQNVSEVLVWEIVQLGPMVLGDNETVGLCCWLNVQERVGELSLEELERRDFSFDDFAEDARGIGFGGHD